MAETIALEIVTPTGVALNRAVNEVTAPSIAGEFGVLPGHLPILVALRTGLVTLKNGNDETRVAVGPGFAQVVGDRALLLTERYAKKEDIDIVAVRARLKEVGDELGSWQGDFDDPKRRELIEEEQWLAASLELIGDPPQPTIREDTRFVANDFQIVEDSGETGAGAEVEGHTHD